VNEWHVKYDKIIVEIKAARDADDAKKLKSAKRKLENWQKGYGAYSPIR
jgi:hypothetical protein